MEKSKSFVQREEIHECVQLGQSKRKINAKICDGSVKKRRATDEEMVGPAWSAELRSPLHKVVLSDIEGQLTVMRDKMSNFEAYIKESKVWRGCIANKIISMEACMDAWNERCVQYDPSLEDEADDDGLKSTHERNMVTSMESFLDLDPDQGYVDWLSFKAFRSWYYLAIKSKPPLKMPLPLQVKTIANAAWFNGILNPKGWLNDDHIDVLLNLIIFKAKFYTGSFLQDWTMLDMMGTGILLEENFELVRSLVLSYVQGSSPREGARSLVKASRVIAMAKISKKYWICLEVSFELQRITVYDSISWTINWSKVKEALKSMTKFIPWICKQEKIWEKKGLKTKLKEVWELVPFKDAPQLHNYSDTGIMSIKFAECLVSSDANAISNIDPERCKIFRRIFCGRLYQLRDLKDRHNLKDLV